MFFLSIGNVIWNFKEDDDFVFGWEFVGLYILDILDNNKVFFVVDIFSSLFEFWVESGKWESGGRNFVFRKVEFFFLLVRISYKVGGIIWCIVEVGEGRFDFFNFFVVEGDSVVGVRFKGWRVLGKGVVDFVW